jgi:hypothetical protein
MSEESSQEQLAEEPDVPEWDDDYLDDVRDRIMHSYDLERDYKVRGEPFTMYGALQMESHKQFFHPSLRFGHYRSAEHLFVRRVDSVDEGDLESLIDLGHELADNWIDPDEEHYITEFTFVLLAPSVPDDVRSFVDGFRDRTLLKGGYYGHYEVNLLVVAPDAEDSVASSEADVEAAFRVWEELEAPEMGFVERLVRRIWR